LLASQPYFLFWLVTAVLRLAARFQRLKPAPLQVAEVAVTYIHSHVLFVLLNLRLAEALTNGPQTAQQLADWAAAKTGAKIHPEWLARVLKLAAELGLVSWVEGLHAYRLNARASVAHGCSSKNGGASAWRDSYSHNVLR
jgi:hypothetical protein